MQIDYKKMDVDELYRKTFSDSFSVEPIKEIKPKYIFKNPFKTDPKNGVILRNWEYRVYKIYDAILSMAGSFINNLIRRVKVWLYRLSLNPLIRTEWRLENGEVVRRRYSGPFGSWKYLDGRAVKYSDQPEVYGTDADLVIATASAIAQERMDKRQELKVKDAEFHAMSMWKSRITPRSSEEIEWGARNQ